MGIPVIPFLMHSFLSIPGTIPATNQEWHHSARIFIPQNVILAGLWANFDSSGFCRIPQEWLESGRNQWGMIKTSKGLARWGQKDSQENCMLLILFTQNYYADNVY